MSDPLRIHGLEFDPLPEGAIPMDGILITKSMVAEGTSVSVRTTSGLSPWEILGLLIGTADDYRNDLACMAVTTDDEED